VHHSFSLCQRCGYDAGSGSDQCPDTPARISLTIGRRQPLVRGMFVMAKPSPLTHRTPNTPHTTHTVQATHRPHPLTPHHTHHTHACIHTRTHPSHTHMPQQASAGEAVDEAMDLPCRGGAAAAAHTHTNARTHTLTHRTHTHVHIPPPALVML
jgi:hypothetical protein